MKHFSSQSMRIDRGLCHVVIISAVLLLSVFLLSGCSSDEEEPSAAGSERLANPVVDTDKGQAVTDPGGLNGVIVDTDTGQPVTDVKITIRENGQSVGVMPTQKGLFPVHSDSDGRFEFSDVPSGEYFLNALKKGYFFYGKDQLIQISSDKPNKIQIDIKKIQTKPEASDGFGRLSGKVQDSETRQPIAEVHLTLQPKGGGEPLTSETGTGGKFEFGPVPSGSHILTAHRENYGDESMRFPIHADKSTTKTVRMLKTSTLPISFGSLSGMVIDEKTAEPVQQVSVVLSPTGKGYKILGQLGISLSAIETGPDGTFQFSRVPEGEYSLNATKDNYSWVNKDRTVLVSAETEASRTLKFRSLSGSETQAIAFRGYVYDQLTGEPVDGAVLVGSNNSFSTHSDENGYFSTQTVPGQLNLTVTHKTHQSYMNEYLVPDPENPQVRIELLPKTTGDIYGMVIDAATGKPIPDVEVTMAGRGLRTDQEGQFQLLAAKAGIIPSNFTHTGYYSNTVIIALEALTEEKLTIKLKPRTNGIISGVVVSTADQSPIAGVLIRSQTESVRTDSNGHFMLDKIEAGTVVVHASEDIYVPAEQEVDVIALQTTNITFSLDPITTGNITGIVVDATTGKPVPDVEVTIAGHALRTDQEGQFQLLAAEAGTIPSKFKHPGYHSSTVSVTLEALTEEKLTIELKPRTDGIISGVVVSAADQSPMAGVLIRSQTESVRTDSNGHFMLDKIEAGTVVVHASEDIYVPAEQEVDVIALQTTNITFSLDPITTGNITGIVVDATTRSPIPEVQVSIKGDSSRTDVDGHFMFEEVESGAVVVNASDPMYVAGSQPVDVKAVQTSDIQISLEPITWGSVAGQVLNLVNNQPIPDVRIDIGGLIISTNDQGQFSHDKVPAGTLEVLASKQVFKSSSKSITLARTESISITMKLNPITTGRITGGVVDAITQVPISNVSVSVDGQSVISDDLGRFEFTEVSAGKLQVVCSKKTYQNSVTAVDLAAADTVNINVPMQLITTGRLSGVLIDAVSGKPIKGVRITIGNQSFETDQDGRFELDSVTAGSVQVSSRHADYKDATAEFQLTPAGTLKIDIKLELRREDVAEMETRLSQDGTIDLYGIHFDSGKDQFKPSSLSTLQALLEVIRRAPDKKFLIAGHTDSDGENSYNQELSERRAKSVMRWLIENGIKGAQLLSKGYGETQPAAPNDTESGKALNRRVQLSQTSEH